MIKSIKQIMDSKKCEEISEKGIDKKEVLKFLDMKYKEKLTDWQIGMRINKDQSTVTRTRQKLVKDIARWEEWYRNVKRLH